MQKVFLAMFPVVFLSSSCGKTQDDFRDTNQDPSLTASVSTISAVLETEPIPNGLNDADDPAVWINVADVNQSRILGTSKFDDDEANPGGLAVYDLSGTMLQFLPVGKLNNVDIIVGQGEGQDLALASNRLTNSISIFAINSQGGVEHIEDILIGTAEEPKEPYGLCAGTFNDQVYVYVTFKDGTLQMFSAAASAPMELSLSKTISLGSLVDSAQDRLIKHNIYQDLLSEDELNELEEEYEERFILEGCAFDSESDHLFVGMERLGVWLIEAISAEHEANLLWPITSSKTIYPSSALGESYHLTDDVEGIGIYYGENGEGKIVVSSQGVDEYVIFDRKSLEYSGAFKVAIGDDPVTATDGLEVSSKLKTADFPEGILVVHDDENSEGESFANGNFKVVSWSDVSSIID